MKNGLMRRLKQLEKSAPSKEPTVVRQRARRTQESDNIGDRNLILLELTDLEVSILDICAWRNSAGNREAYALGWLRAGLENDIDSASHDLRKGGAR